MPFVHAAELTHSALLHVAAVVVALTMSQVLTICIDAMPVGGTCKQRVCKTSHTPGPVDE